MENLKIRVNSADESKEAQELLEFLGINTGIKILSDYIYADFLEMEAYNHVLNPDEYKKITLAELRAMANPMKEYLNANCNYEFVLSNKKYDGFIEIPEGAIRARFYPRVPDGLEFENSTRQWWHDKDNEWINYENYSNTLKHSRVVWQRDQDEPFLTPECTLNDQYAEIEQVRQATKDNVNHPSHYADSAIECIDAMEAMMTREQFIGYLRGNLFKYQWRYEKKNGIEDLRKAQWYLEKLTVKVAEKMHRFKDSSNE